jgi:peptidoglycan/LPS O-acetylase OafA/YrhL
MIGTVVMMALFPDYRNLEEEGTPLPLLPVILNLAMGCLAGVGGGFVAAFLARRARWLHAGILALLVFVAGVVYAFVKSGGPQPDWYLALLPVTGAISIVAGGGLGSRRGRK